MSDRLTQLLAAENSAKEAVEDAERRSREIRTGIPEEAAEIEKEYESELEKYESRGLEKIDEELKHLRSELDETLRKRTEDLDESASVLAPRALELVRQAVEGEGA